MRITAVIAAVSVLLCVLAACSREPGNGGDAPTLGSLRVDQVDESQQARGSQRPVASAQVAYFGVRSLEERTVERDTVVVATLSTTTAEVITPSGGYWPGGHSIGVFFHLEVSEYLVGSGPASITVLSVTGTKESRTTYDTVAEAEADIPKVLATIDTTWNDREAVFFLHSNSDLVNGVVDHVVDGNDEFFMAYGSVGRDPDDGYVYDGYSLRDRNEQLWLPSANTGATGDDREFLLAVPQQGVEDRTITLRELKRVVSSVSAKVSAGDGSYRYRVCLRWVYTVERDNKYRRDTGQEDENYHTYRPDSDDLFMESSQPASVEIYKFHNGGSASTTDEDSERTRVWLSGDDSGHFSVRNGSLRPYPGSDVGHVFDISVVSARPLPAGTYTFTQHYAPEHLILCNHVYEHEIEVSVSMQGDSMHEFFFDPVTVGSAVGADGTNGVLRPTSFTTTDGTPATVESMSYEAHSPGSGQAGRVRVKVVPWDELSGVLDVIELDGTVSTSLRVSNSAVDVGSNTFTWSVSSQPWEDGDRLMVRIRPAAPFAPAPHRLSATTMGNDSIGLSWESVSGVTGHVVEQRVSGVARWESVDTDVKEKSHTVSGLWCGTTYEFRVSAHGDGTQYETVPGPGVSHHSTVSETTEACSAQESPTFANAAYSFSIVEDAPVGSTVGAVSATDPQDDTVTYSITSGNEGERFAIDGSTGLITLAGTLDHDTAASHTLTAQAADGSGGRGTATVTVMVELASCAGGTAVPSPADNPGLVSDCLALLAARDALEGTATLNWTADVAIGKWQGVGVAGTPGRVRSLSLSGLEMDGALPSALSQLSALESLWMEENRLTGNIPPELGGLRLLKRLSLDDNLLTGPIPESLGRLTYLHTLALADNGLSGSIPVGLGGLGQLRYLSLGGNALTGSVPSQLGSLGSLQNLYLGQNRLTGGIPSELGGLSKLEVLYLHGNGLTGAIPPELGGLGKLEELALRRNALTGSVPSELGRLTKLVYLTLSGNMLTGCVPSGLRSISDHDLDRLGLAYCEA